MTATLAIHEHLSGTPTSAGERARRTGFPQDDNRRAHLFDCECHSLPRSVYRRGYAGAVQQDCLPVHDRRSQEFAMPIEFEGAR